MTEPLQASPITPSPRLGHDAPIYDRRGDVLDREPVAAAISKIIRDAPYQWSTRIGLYGRWGEGKSSVLNLVAKQEEAAGNVVVPFTAWGAHTEEEVWSGFGKVLLKALREHGIGTSWLARLNFSARDKATFIARWVKRGGQVVDIKAPGAALVVNAVAPLVLRHARLSKDTIQYIVRSLGARKLVVLIDDLDRTDPTLIPNLLLAFRELLDISGFAFVLAFDREVVVTALQNQNAAWGVTGSSFLEKVIDFPVALPNLTNQQVRAFAASQFKALCPFVPDIALEQVSGALPSNPRRLKLLARLLGSMRDEAKRHDDDGELDWTTIVLATLLRGENEELAQAFFHKVLTEHGFHRLRPTTLAANHEPDTAQDEITALMEAHDVPKADQPRIRQIVTVWRDTLSSMWGPEMLRYQLTFALSPQAITWKEYGVCFAAWRADRQRVTIDRWATRAAIATQRSLERTMEEFCESAVTSYGKILQEASEIGALADHTDCVVRASDTLDLLVQLFTGTEAAQTFSAEFRVRLLRRLYAIAIQWSNFNVNPGEADLRLKEVQTIAALAPLVGCPLLVFEALLFRETADSFFTERAQVKELIGGAIRAEIEPRAMEEALEYLTTPGRIKAIRSIDAHRAARFFLTAPQSPLFADSSIGNVLAVLRSRQATREAAGDGIEYMEIMLTALSHHDPYCNRDARVAFFAAHKELAVAIWDLATCAPSQYRFLSALRENRVSLVSCGVDPAALNEPEWLTAGTDVAGTVAPIAVEASVKL